MALVIRLSRIKINFPPVLPASSCDIQHEAPQHRPMAIFLNRATSTLLLHSLCHQATAFFSVEWTASHGKLSVLGATRIADNRYRCRVHCMGNTSSEDGAREDIKRAPPRSVLPRPWDVEVDLNGDRHFITVQPGDSILEAAEMSGMNLAYECRRGNCISCAARVKEGSTQNFENKADRRPEDGAPEGFVLTCSTYPVGPGVKLELSMNSEMWTAYCERFEDAETQQLLRQASAGVILDYNVRHPEEFREEVERQFGAL